jgi:acetyl esterase
VIDPEFEAALAVLPPSDISDPAAQRQRVAQASAPLAGLADHRVTVLEEVVAGLALVPVPVRIYVPTAATGTVLFFHGGGFVMGTLDLEQRRCLHWAAHAGVAVVSVGYRLAPEHPYPAAVDDGEAVLAWLRDGPAGLASHRPLVVAGSSAGGCLAATLAARHRSSFALQLLICPVLDDRVNSGSMIEFECTAGWNGRASAQMWRYYLGSDYLGPGAPVEDAVPARAADLAGQPPAFIVVAGLDPLRDEGLDHAKRLAAAGVPAELHQVPGVPHGFDVINPDARVSRELLTSEAAAIRRACLAIEQ